MSETNMDIKKNPTATVPVFEFSLPKAEVDAAVSVDEHGKLIIPVHVVAVGKDTVTFRKEGKAEAESEFRPESLESMRSRMGVVQDEEMPMKGDSEKSAKDKPSDA